MWVKVVGKSRGCLKIKIKVAYISICDLQFNDDGEKKLCKTGQKETLLLAKKQHMVYGTQTGFKHT